MDETQEKSREQQALEGLEKFINRIHSINGNRDRQNSPTEKKSMIIRQKKFKTVRRLEGRTFDEKPPVPIEISGTISAPRLWLEKRLESQIACPAAGVDCGFIVPAQAHVLVDREKLQITLIFNETDPFQKSRILGSLQLSEEFKAWNLFFCEFYSWDPFELAMQIQTETKWTVFEEKSVAPFLITLLKELSKLYKLEGGTNPDGTRKISTLAGEEIFEDPLVEFNLNLPIFKGQPKQAFHVIAYQDAKDPVIYLHSPEALELEKTYPGSILDQEVDQIRKIAPHLAILEV